jgi:hypothetical protein
MQVVDVSEQKRACILITRRIHRLRKVDDHRAIRRQEHVEVGEISVHHTRTQHARRLVDKMLVDFLRLGGRKLQIT